MYGFNNLPNKTDQNTFVFYANASGSTSGSFQAWNVPEYASFLHFTVIGGGGGGGGGGTTGNAFGGLGGAPAGIVAVSIPTILLPKTLYLQVSYGGTGGQGNINANGSPGSSGSISYVCLYPEINPGSILIQSSNVAAGGGGGGTSLSGQLVLASNIVIADVLNLKWLGIVGNTVAQTSGVTTDTSVTYAGLLTGGAGGGRRALPGGNQTMTSINAYVTTTINGGAAGVSANGSPGNNGYFSWKPFIATGGAGGGGGATGAFNGGRGGNGAFGCGGGGGGGGGATTVSGGQGGNGGDGLIIITVS